MKVKLNKNGYYSLKFRVSKKLIKYMNKSIISKSLGTNNFNEANTKAVIIISKYKELLKVLDLLDEKTIQSLVDKYIYETLEQDKVSRAVDGYGLVASDYATHELSTLRDDYQVNLANNNYDSVIDLAKELLQDVGIEFNNKEVLHRLFLQQLMQANIEIYDESYNRCFGRYNSMYNTTFLA